MRRKSSGSNNGGGFNHGHKKQRYSHGGGGGNNNNRPRKNYSAMREKYLNQARDAMASGDRVLAENYLQHAEHCYRMLAEEGYFNRPQHQHNPQQPQQPGETAEATETAEAPEEVMPENNSALPAFLTGGYESQKPVDPANIQNWEDRDAS